MSVHQSFLGVITVLLVCGSGASQSNGAIQVRLVNGSSRYEGTVHYSSDHGTTWHPLCGTNLSINEVKVICRQLGFNGANRIIRHSPFGIDSTTADTSFNCAGGEDNLQECPMVSMCPFMSGERNPGAAVCYDERYLGCFNYKQKNRVLQRKNTFEELTIEQCINHCILTQYVFAGVKKSEECYCGDASAQLRRLKKVGDDGCQFHCAGDVYSSCGGEDNIAIFNLSVIIPPSGIETTVPSLTTLTTMKTRADPTADRELTTILTDPKSAESTKFALLGSVGGGGGFLVIILIVIVAFINCRRRKVKSDAPASTLPMASRATEENKNNEHELQYFDITDTTNCYKDSAISDPAVLYEMPDLSAKSSSRKPGTDTSPDKIDDLSLLYVMPSEQTAKNEADVGALYAVPDEERGDHVTPMGIGIHTPREGPGKQDGADDDDDNTVMIENEIYNS